MQNVFVMIGYPGSGKSTIAHQIANNNPNISVLDGDALKTSNKVIVELRKRLDAGSSAIIDACNNTLERRQAIINECQARNIPVYGLWIRKSMEESMLQAKKREEAGGPHISKMAFYTMRKNFIEPTLAEGFLGISLL